MAFVLGFWIVTLVRKIIRTWHPRYSDLGRKCHSHGLQLAVGAGPGADSIGDAVGACDGDAVGDTVGDVVGLMVGDVVGLPVGGAVGGTADFPWDFLLEDFPLLLLVAEVPSSSPLDLPLPPFAL
jgi:hypothetical protein